MGDACPQSPLVTSYWHIKHGQNFSEVINHLNLQRTRIGVINLRNIQGDLDGMLTAKSHELTDMEVSQMKYLVDTDYEPSHLGHVLGEVAVEDSDDGEEEEPSSSSELPLPRKRGR